MLANGFVQPAVPAYILNAHNYYLGCKFFCKFYLGYIFKKRGISKSTSSLTRGFDHFLFPKDAANESELCHECNACSSVY